MEGELVIHCIGLEGLTITVAGADHSIPLTTDVLRVTTLLGSVEYTVPQLPATYDLADLKGNLTISDGSGKALYRWRLHAIPQLSAAEHQQPGDQPVHNAERERHSSSTLAPPSYRTAETQPTSRSSETLIEPSNGQNSFMDAETVADDQGGSRQLRSRPGRRIDYHPESTPDTNSSEDYITSSTPVRRSRRHAKRKLNGKFNASGDSGPEPLGSAPPSFRKQIHESRSMAANKGDSDLDSSKPDIAPSRKPRTKWRERIRLVNSSDEESETPFSDMTQTRKVLLQQLVDRLIEENGEDSKPYAEPVDAVAEDLPTYHTVIERAMDLRTLKENLGRGRYSAVDNFKAYFHLMIENSIRFNGLTHEVSQSGRRLLIAFRVLMASLPGRS